MTLNNNSNKLLKNIVFVSFFATVPWLHGCTSTSSGSGIFSGKVPTYYTVKPGDTVSKIAKRYGLNWRDVSRKNRLNANHTVYVGQRLSLAGAKKGYNTPARSWQARNNSTRRRAKGVDNRRINNPTPRPTVVNYSVNQSWKKPTSNTVIANFNQDKGIKGMRFAGSKGDPVYASQSGQVIYANSGLVEYGNLILINHGNNFISAYAHNDTMMVKEGQRVSAGDKIATMGSSGTNRVMLEFQVRKNGQPIDPKNVLK